MSKSSAIATLWVSICPSYTKPVPPSIEIWSPSTYFLPLIITWSSLTLKSLLPTIQALPIPLATTAACEVIPPRAVKIPSDRFIPSISSGDVSILTKIVGRPLSAYSTAFLALKTIKPEAAPGLAGKPVAIGSISCKASNLNCGCNSPSIISRSKLSMASFLLIIPSLTKSLAILTAAWAVLLPALVWRIKSL